MTAPLDNILVLDWTQWQMGPVATAMLAELGAEVIHIENKLTGDGGRNLNSLKWTLPKGRNAYFEINNRGKKSISVDLTKDRGRELIYSLVKKADVFVHNYRQGVPEKLKLDYETVRQHNPRIIYAAASGYGPKGPEAKEPAFDYMGLARSGIMHMISGLQDLPPLTVRLGIADQMGAIMTAYGILAAIIARERLGIGQKVDVSHLGSLIALEGLGIGLELYLGQIYGIEDRKFTPNPLWNYYLCSDRRWIMLGMLQPDKQWPAVCKALGIEYLEKDPRFENANIRTENAEIIIAIMDSIFITKSAGEWMKILKDAGDIICTPIQRISDLKDDPQVLANDYIVNCNHEVLGPVKISGLPVQFSETPGRINCEAPEFGQHTEEVLINILGCSWEEISSLREKGVI